MISNLDIWLADALLKCNDFLNQARISIEAFHLAMSEIESLVDEKEKA